LRESMRSFRCSIISLIFTSRSSPLIVTTSPG
jgi:hypothetical protein